MKKRWILIVALLVFSLLIFSGCEDNLAGEASRGTKTKVLPAYDENKCYDLDQGIKEFVKGTTKGTLGFSRSTKYVTNNDYCEDITTLVEYYCSRNKVYSKKITCDFGCQEGVCLEESPIEELPEENENIEEPQIIDQSFCELLIGDGSTEHLDIIFVSQGFSEEEIETDIKQGINKLMYGKDGGLLPVETTGFFEMQGIQENQQKINIHLITADATPFYDGFDDSITEFVKTTCLFFEEGKDAIVFQKNEDSIGNFITATYSSDLSVKFITLGPSFSFPSDFVHEFGHAFAGLNEEYYVWGSYFSEQKLYDDPQQQVGWGAVNCDLGKNPCTKWCGGVDTLKYDQTIAAQELANTCLDALDQSDGQSWQETCLQIDFSSHLKTIGGAHSKEELCVELPASSNFCFLYAQSPEYYSCYQAIDNNDQELWLETCNSLDFSTFAGKTKEELCVEIPTVINPAIICTFALKEQFQECKTIFDNNEEVAWPSYCNSLDLAPGLEANYGMTEEEYFNSFDGTVCGASNVDGLCSSSPDDSCNFLCTLNLDKLRYESIGLNCEEGKGCYFGCGGALNAYRSTPCSVMGCGGLSDFNTGYGVVANGVVAQQPLFPDLVPGFNEIGQEELQKQFDKYS